MHTQRVLAEQRITEVRGKPLLFFNVKNLSHKNRNLIMKSCNDNTEKPLIMILGKLHNIKKNELTGAPRLFEGKHFVSLSVRTCKKQFWIRDYCNRPSSYGKKRQQDNQRL